MKRLLTPRDLAQAIGVDERAVFDWAGGGQLAIARTGGGHRRIPIAEAVRFIRASHAVVSQPVALGLPELADADSDYHVEDALYRCLYEGLGREARGLLLRRFLAGDSIASLADGPIRGAMHRLGELWKHDARGIFIEHRATDCCIQAVSALGALVDPPDAAPIAIGGAPSGDPYVIPSLVAATVLSADGLRAMNLGPETPISSMRMAVAAHRPRLVWLSCSAPVTDHVAEDIAAFASELRSAGVTLVRGGRLASQFPTELGALGTSVTSMAELSTVARELLGRDG